MSKDLDSALEEIAIHAMERAAKLPTIKPGMVHYPLLVESVLTLQRTAGTELIQIAPDA